MQIFQPENGHTRGWSAFLTVQLGQVINPTAEAQIYYFFLFCKWNYSAVQVRSGVHF